MNGPVLVIGDVHEPVAHPGYFDFIVDMADRYNPSRIVFIGDIVDNHACSFHAHHPMCPGPQDELEMMIRGVQKWHRAFPKATVTIGNHDERPGRLAEAANIQYDWLRTYNEVFGSHGWEWVEEAVIDDVYYFHGTAHGGVHPAYNKMKNLGMSVVMGHTHTQMGVKYQASPVKLTFGMDTGCGVDRLAWAMAYGSKMRLKPALGCGVVWSSECACVVPMPCGPGQRYHRDRFVSQGD
jgi:metallophosphoesterase superfamily enzyme